MLSPDQIGAYSVALVTSVFAALERIRSNREAKKREESSEAVSDAKMQKERADLMSNLAVDYKALFEKEHVEFNEYREYQHKKAGDDQVRLMTAQERIQELQSRPDYSDLFEHLKTQSDLSVKILENMNQVLQSIKILIDRTQPGAH